MRTYFQPSYLRYFLRYFLVTRSLSPRFCRPRRIITRHMRTPRVYILDAHALFYSLSISCHDNFCNPYTPLPPQLVRFSTIFFFFTTFSCIEPCGMPMLRRHEGSRESRRTFVLRGKNYFLNQLAVTSSLKTLKSAYLKCVVRSKRRRVYSSSTEYVWLL